MAVNILDGKREESILYAVSLLKKGELVAFPTETVYGLGADALNPYAVIKIFEVKRRPRFDPLIVHIAEERWLEDLAEWVPITARRLVERFWPGPLTIILEKRSLVPDVVTAGLKTVAIRMPSHPVAQKLLRTFSNPVAAPSANPFGYLSPTKAEHVARVLGEKIPLILDGGACEYGIESTILSFFGEKVYIHRHGSITQEEIESVVGRVEEWKGEALAPGRLSTHYAPKRPIRIVESAEEVTVANSAFLAFRTPSSPLPSRYVRVLSERGDLREAATRFFSFLYELDREDVEVIYVERIPDRGLGRAMMERLRKASKSGSL